VQGTYTYGKTKFGINYGQNRDKNGFLNAVGGGPDDYARNQSTTVGVYHSLNKFITLVGEFNYENITNAQDTNYDNKNKTISLGGIMFF